jgi:ATP-dependent Clp protease, protease subunit
MARKTDLDNIAQFHEYGIYVPGRTIKLDLDGSDSDDPTSVEVGPATASKLIKNLIALDSINHEPITIIMNCPGGNVVDGLAIYDAICASKSHVTIQVLGEASSMGAFILQAADHRQMYPFSRLMLHDGSISVAGNHVDVEKSIEHEKYWRFRMYKMLEHRTGVSSQYWKRKMQTDWFLSAEQALKEKLIDEIISGT